MARKPKPARRQRGHGVLPAGFTWREGRPRWIPSPTRRAQGWRPVDLAVTTARDKTWLSMGDAISRCEAINAAVKAWTLKGQPVPPDMALFAPKGSIDATGPTPAQMADRRSIGGLKDAWLASPAFTLDRKQGGLSDASKGDYRRKLNRLFEALVESDSPDKVKALLALPIETLAAPEEEGEDFPLEQAYAWLMANAGHNMAHGVMQVASIWFTWLFEKKRIKAMAVNPVRLIDRATPEGRIRVGTVQEVAALVAAADAMPGHAFVADALLLALDLGWSLADILRLDWRRVVKTNGTWKVTRNARQKTGITGSGIPLMAIGAARLEKLILRNAGEAVTGPWLIARTPGATKPITGRLFNDYWNAVRDRAATDAPSLKAGDGIDGSEHAGPFNFMDARDTFITLAREVPLSVEETCSRSQHQPSRVHAVWQKHYGAITPLTAAEGARKMAAHLSATGWTDALT